MPVAVLFLIVAVSSERFGDVILCSVVPPLQPIWERVCEKLFGHPPIVIGLGTRTGMPVRYENPREVGAVERPPHNERAGHPALSGALPAC